MLTVRRLIWEPWNIAHIARHNVTPGEVEDVCHSNPIVRKTYDGRLRVTGLNKSRRLLTVILAPKGKGVFYPVTARPADHKERRIYQQQKGGAKP